MHRAQQRIYCCWVVHLKILQLLLLLLLHGVLLFQRPALPAPRPLLVPAWGGG
jgi:hypothetical protein